MNRSLQNASYLAVALALALILAWALSACGGFQGSAPQTLLVCDFRALENNSRHDGPALLAQAYDSVSAIPSGAVLIADAALFRQVIAQSIYSVTNASGTARITVRFANCSGATLQLRARTSFIGNSGAPAEPMSAWTTLFIPAGLTAAYEETSVSRSISGFYVELASN